MSTHSPSWNHLIPAYASHLGAHGARSLARHVLVLTLLRAQVQGRTPFSMTTAEIGAFLESLPRAEQDDAQAVVAEFLTFACDERRALTSDEPPTARRKKPRPARRGRRSS